MLPGNRFAGVDRWLSVFLLLSWLLLSPGAAEEKNKNQLHKPVNLNTATLSELVDLPGVGEAIARRILSHREKSGRFRSVEELLVIRGISRKKLEALRPHVTVEPESRAEPKRGKNPR